jgi:hypothetical protein
LTTVDNDTGGKFSANVNNSAVHFASGVVETGVWWCPFPCENLREFLKNNNILFVKFKNILDSG